MSSPFSDNPYQSPEAPLEPPPPEPCPPRSPRYCVEAIAALVCSSVGCAFCGILVDPPICGVVVVEPIALILSMVTLKKTRDDPTLKGRGMAVAGMVVSIASFVLIAVLWELFLIGISNRPR
jgi:hypothetical protein